QDLYEATHETVHLGVLVGSHVLYIDKISGRYSSPVATQIGTRKPMYCTALGKAILAFSPPELLASLLREPLTRYTAHTISTPEALLRELAEVRKAGVAYDREEYTLGITCVAAP